MRFCKENGLEFDNVNNNYPNLSFKTSNKIYANLYIDNRSVINYFSNNLDESNIYNYKAYVEYLIERHKEEYHLDML